MLRLSDLDHSKTAVLNAMSSPASRRTYTYAIEQFITWYCSEPRLALNRIVVVRYRIHLEASGLAASTINQRLAAVRRLAHEAADCGLLSADLAAGIQRVKGARQLGHRSGNWLSLEQSSQLVNCAYGDGLRERRDCAMLAILVGCGLRRAELANLPVEKIQVPSRPLGHRGPGRQGRTCSHHTNSPLGQREVRPMDLCRRDQHRTSVPCHSQEWNVWGDAST